MFGYEQHFLRVKGHVFSYCNSWRASSLAQHHWNLVPMRSPRLVTAVGKVCILPVELSWKLHLVGTRYGPGGIIVITGEYITPRTCPPLLPGEWHCLEVLCCGSCNGKLAAHQGCPSAADWIHSLCGRWRLYTPDHKLFPYQEETQLSEKHNVGCCYWM